MVFLKKKKHTKKNLVLEFSLGLGTNSFQTSSDVEGGVKWSR